MAMTADFMLDVKYAELCGSKTVFELTATLGNIYDSYNAG